MVLLKPVQGSYYIKWLRRDLLDSVAAMQCYSSHRFMSKAKFEELLTREPRSDGFVITGVMGKPLGYILYRRHARDGMIHFIDLVIHPDHRRKGLGSLLVRWMKNRMPDDFRAILATARDDDPLSHLFLRQSGFFAYRVLEGFFGKNTAAYCFIYSQEDNVIRKARRKKENE